MPAIAELAAHYAVAGGTVAKALGILAEEGLVEVIPRWGTFKT